MWNVNTDFFGDQQLFIDGALLRRTVQRQIIGERLSECDRSKF
jgi:hypothetical protein